jgi:tetratricopeptide (TPR) repeat protein
MPLLPRSVTAVLSLSIAVLSVQPAVAQQQPTQLTLQSLPPATTTPANIPSAPAAAADPLAIGKQAMQHNDYQTAQAFFANYLKGNPGNLEALLLEGNASLALKQYAAAGGDFQSAIDKVPTLWAAHKNLVIAYAGQGKWQEFDQERRLLQEARASDAAGLSKTEADVIEVLYFGTDRYVVRAFPVLTGRFKARYNFAHYGKDDKLDSWLACESNDVDQAAFAQKHPKEAAAGQRSFALDGYSISPTTTTHATIKLYPDGEPSYETVRTDVIGVLGHKKQ